MNQILYLWQVGAAADGHVGHGAAGAGTRACCWGRRVRRWRERMLGLYPARGRREGIDRVLQMRMAFVNFKNHYRQFDL